MPSQPGLHPAEKPFSLLIEEHAPTKALHTDSLNQGGRSCGRQTNQSFRSISSDDDDCACSLSLHLLERCSKSCAALFVEQGSRECGSVGNAIRTCSPRGRAPVVRADGSCTSRSVKHCSALCAGLTLASLVANCESAPAAHVDSSPKCEASQEGPSIFDHSAASGKHVQALPGSSLFLQYPHHLKAGAHELEGEEEATSATCSDTAVHTETASHPNEDARHQEQSGTATAIGRDMQSTELDFVGKQRQGQVPYPDRSPKNECVAYGTTHPTCHQGRGSHFQTRYGVSSSVCGRRRHEGHTHGSLCRGSAGVACWGSGAVESASRSGVCGSSVLAPSKDSDEEAHSSCYYKNGRALGGSPEDWAENISATTQSEQRASRDSSNSASRSMERLTLLAHRLSLWEVSRKVPSCTGKPFGGPRLPLRVRSASSGALCCSPASSTSNASTMSSTRQAYAALKRARRNTRSRDYRPDVYFCSMSCKSCQPQQMTCSSVSATICDGQGSRAQSDAMCPVRLYTKKTRFIEEKESASCHSRNFNTNAYHSEEAAAAGGFITPFQAELKRHQQLAAERRTPNVSLSILKMLEEAPTKTSHSPERRQAGVPCNLVCHCSVDGQEDETARSIGSSVADRLGDRRVCEEEKQRSVNGYVGPWRTRNDDHSVQCLPCSASNEDPGNVGNRLQVFDHPISWVQAFIAQTSDCNGDTSCGTKQVGIRPQCAVTTLSGEKRWGDRADCTMSISNTAVVGGFELAKDRSLRSVHRGHALLNPRQGDTYPQMGDGVHHHSSHSVGERGVRLDQMKENTSPRSANSLATRLRRWDTPSNRCGEARSSCSLLVRKSPPGEMRGRKRAASLSSLVQPPTGGEGRRISQGGHKSTEEADHREPMVSFRVDEAQKALTRGDGQKQTDICARHDSGESDDDTKGEQSVLDFMCVVQLENETRQKIAADSRGQRSSAPEEPFSAPETNGEAYRTAPTHTDGESVNNRGGIKVVENEREAKGAGGTDERRVIRCRCPSDDTKLETVLIDNATITCVGRTKESTRNERPGDQTSSEDEEAQKCEDKLPSDCGKTESSLKRQRQSRDSVEVLARSSLASVESAQRFWSGMRSRQHSEGKHVPAGELGAPPESTAAAEPRENGVGEHVGGVRPTATRTRPHRTSTAILEGCSDTSSPLLEPASPSSLRCSTSFTSSSGPSTVDARPPSVNLRTMDGASGVFTDRYRPRQRDPFSSTAQPSSSTAWRTCQSRQTGCGSAFTAYVCELSDAVCETEGQVNLETRKGKEPRSFRTTEPAESARSSIVSPRWCPAVVSGVIEAETPEHRREAVGTVPERGTGLIGAWKQLGNEGASRQEPERCIDEKTTAAMERDCEENRLLPRETRGMGTQGVYTLRPDVLLRSKRSDENLAAGSDSGASKLNPTPQNEDNTCTNHYSLQLGNIISTHDLPGDGPLPGNRRVAARNTCHSGRREGNRNMQELAAGGRECSIASQRRGSANLLLRGGRPHQREIPDTDEDDEGSSRERSSTASLRPQEPLAVNTPAQLPQDGSPFSAIRRKGYEEGLRHQGGKVHKLQLVHRVAYLDQQTAAVSVFAPTRIPKPDSPIRGARMPRFTVKNFKKACLYGAALGRRHPSIKRSLPKQGNSSAVMVTLEKDDGLGFTRGDAQAQLRRCPQSEETRFGNLQRKGPATRKRSKYNIRHNESEILRDGVPQCRSGLSEGDALCECPLTTREVTPQSRVKPSESRKKKELKKCRCWGGDLTRGRRDKDLVKVVVEGVQESEEPSLSFQQWGDGKISLRPQPTGRRMPQLSVASFGTFCLTAGEENLRETPLETSVASTARVCTLEDEQGNKQRWETWHPNSLHRPNDRTGEHSVSAHKNHSLVVVPSHFGALQAPLCTDPVGAVASLEKTQHASSCLHQRPVPESGPGRSPPHTECLRLPALQDVPVPEQTVGTHRARVCSSAIYREERVPRPNTECEEGGTAFLEACPGSGHRNTLSYQISPERSLHHGEENQQGKESCFLHFGSREERIATARMMVRVQMKRLLEEDKNRWKVGACMASLFDRVSTRCRCCCAGTWQTMSAERKQRCGQVTFWALAGLLAVLILIALSCLVSAKVLKNSE